jgi:hypothetical protein
VSFTLTFKATRETVEYYTALVDPFSGEATVLLDRDLSEFVPEELDQF